MALSSSILLEDLCALDLNGIDDTHDDRIDGTVLGLDRKAGGATLGAEHDLTSNQARLLALLQRAGAMRLRDVATQLGVTAPTASQTISSLARRGIVAKERDPGDKRALRLTLTQSGLRLAEVVGTWSEDLREAVLELPDDSLDGLMRSLVLLVRALGERDRIPVAVVCVACSAFRPNAHPGSDKPHHCAMIDRPLASADLRWDCPAHEPAPAEQQQAAWRALREG